MNYDPTLCLSKLYCFWNEVFSPCKDSKKN